MSRSVCPMQISADCSTSRSSRASRAPVIAHVSDSGTGIAVDRACYAEKPVPPLYCNLDVLLDATAAMVLEHLAQIGRAVKIPFFVLYSPD